MLKARIQSEAVRHNIDLFQQIMDSEAQVTAYKAFVNCLTGNIRFNQFDFLNKNEWKEITIHLKPETHEVEVFDKTQKAFDISLFDPLAYCVMAETFYVLQYILKKLPDFKDLAAIKLEASMDRAFNTDLVHKAWHSIDRVKAESLLSGQEIGTYIFRQDEYAKVLEKELSTNLKVKVKCVTLTYLDERSTIKDKTLVKYKNQWLFYDNDPSLSGEGYGDVSYLLDASQEIFRKPLEQH